MVVDKESLCAQDKAALVSNNNPYCNPLQCVTRRLPFRDWKAFRTFIPLVLTLYINSVCAFVGNEHIQEEQTSYNKTQVVHYLFLILDCLILISILATLWSLWHMVRHGWVIFDFPWMRLVSVHTTTSFGEDQVVSLDSGTMYWLRVLCPDESQIDFHQICGSYSRFRFFNSHLQNRNIVNLKLVKNYNVYSTQSASGVRMHYMYVVYELRVSYRHKPVERTTFSGTEEFLRVEGMFYHHLTGEQEQMVGSFYNCQSVLRKPHFQEIYALVWGPRLRPIAPRIDNHAPLRFVHSDSESDESDSDDDSVVTLPVNASAVVVPVPNAHVVSSTLNGNNGSWTNTDDIDSENVRRSREYNTNKHSQHNRPPPAECPHCKSKGLSYNHPELNCYQAHPERKKQRCKACLKERGRTLFHTPDVCYTLHPELRHSDKNAIKKVGDILKAAVLGQAAVPTIYKVDDFYSSGHKNNLSLPKPSAPPAEDDESTISSTATPVRNERFPGGSGSMGPGTAVGSVSGSEKYEGSEDTAWKDIYSSTGIVEVTRNLWSSVYIACGSMFTVSSLVNAQFWRMGSYYSWPHSFAWFTGMSICHFGLVKFLPMWYSFNYTKAIKDTYSYFTDIGSHSGLTSFDAVGAKRVAYQSHRILSSRGWNNSVLSNLNYKYVQSVQVYPYFIEQITPSYSGAIVNTNTSRFVYDEMMKASVPISKTRNCTFDKQIIHNSALYLVQQLQILRAKEQQTMSVDPPVRGFLDFRF